MEINTQFCEEDWDDISETSPLHLSYIIKTLLPVRWIGWKTGSASKSYDQFISQNSPSDSEPVIFQPTGSLAEGIGIPEAISRTGSSKVDVFSDFDLLCIFKGMKFLTKEISQPSEEFAGYLEYDFSPPGYARVRLLSQPNNPAVCVYSEETGKRYFSSSSLSNLVFSQLSVSDRDRSRQKVQQGPSMAVVDLGTQTLNDKIKVQPVNGVPMDFVPAFSCAPWPDQASGWIERGKKSEWLNPQLVDSIVGDGCHVVGVPSKTSSNPDIEWRMSFSASEGRIAREAVTDHQRQCYIYLKILRLQIMRQETISLSSYVFKSVFLHCCEHLPVGHWEKYPGNCVLFMIDVLHKCLERKHVPTYFLPENNLVGHFSDSEFETAKEIVRKIRSHPITPVLDFTDDKCLLLHPLLGTFRLIVQPILDDMKEFKHHRDKMISIKRGMLESTFRFCQLYLREHSDVTESLGLRKHQEAVRCFAEAFRHWLHQLFPANTLGQVINSYGLSIRSLEHSLRFFKAAISLIDEFPDLAVCRGNLACIYHASAYNDDVTVNTGDLKQASELFEQMYTENKLNVIDFATFLVKQQEYGRARGILECYIKDVDHSSDKTIYSYSRRDVRTLDDALRGHVEAHGNVTGDGLSFACYYLVKCLLVLNPRDSESQIDNVLEVLQQHAKDKRTDAGFSFLEQAKAMVMLS